MSEAGGARGMAGYGGSTPNLGPTAVWVNNNNNTPPLQQVTDQLGGLHLSQNSPAMSSAALSTPLQQHYFTLAQNNPSGLQMGTSQLQLPPLTNGFHQQVASQGAGGLSLPLQSATPLAAPVHAPLSFSISLPQLGSGGAGNAVPLQGGLNPSLQTYSSLVSPIGFSSLQSSSSSFSSVQSPSSAFNNMLSPTASFTNLQSPASSFGGVQNPTSSFGSLQSPSFVFSPSYNAASVGSPPAQSFPMSGHALPAQSSFSNSIPVQGSPLIATSLGNSGSHHRPLQGNSSLPLNAGMGHQQVAWQGSPSTYTIPTPPPAPPLPSLTSTPSYSSYNSGASNSGFNNGNNYSNSSLNNGSTYSSNSLNHQAHDGAMLRELQAQIEARSREHHHTQELEARAREHGSTSPVPLPGMTGGPCHTVTHDSSDPGIGPAGSATADFYSTFSRPVSSSGSLHTRTDSAGSGFSGPESAGESSPVLHGSLNRRLTRTDSAASVLSNSSLGGTAEFYSTFGHNPSPALVRADSLGSCHSGDGRSGEHTHNRVVAREGEVSMPEPPKVLPEPKPCYDRPKQKDLCMRCGKKVYAMEKLGPPVKDAMYHKHCFTCVVCGTMLTLKNFHHNPNDIDDLNVFCGPHTPVAKAAAMDAGAVDIRRALHVPKAHDKVNEQIRSGPDAHGLNDLEAVSIRSALHAPKRDIPSYEKYPTTHFNPWDN